MKKIFKIVKNITKAIIYTIALTTITVGAVSYYKYQEKQVRASYAPKTQEQLNNDLILLAKGKTRQILKDPKSAKFANIFIANDGVCGTVNAKNSFGAYTGQQQFLFFYNQPAVNDGSKEFAETFNKLCLNNNG